MFQSATDTDLDLRKVIKSIAQLNPHVSLSDIAYLMDVSYEPDACEYEDMDIIERF